MTLLKLTLSLVLTTLVADVAHAQTRCTFLPKAEEKITLLGHQRWAEDGLRIFPADEGVAYTIATGFTAIGGEVANGCVTYPKSQAGVQVDPAQFVTEAIDLSDKFTAKLVYPKGMSSADVTAMRKMLAVMADKVGQLYPLGFNPADKDDFYIVATAGLAGVGYLNTQRIKTPIGKNLGMLALPPKPPDFDAEVIRLLVDMYTKARPHPLMGPKDRSDKRDLKIDFGRELYTLNTEDYDALVAGWATIALAADKDHALERLYNTVLDYYAYTDAEERTEAQDLTLSHIQNASYLKDFKGIRTASENDAYFYRYVGSVIDAMRVAGEAAAADKSFEKAVKDVNAGTEIFLSAGVTEDVLKRGMEGYRASDLQKQQDTSIEQTFTAGEDVFDFAQKLGYIDVPELPPSEEIFSQGAYLDGRLYQQDQSKLADKVFLVTSFQVPGFAYAKSQSLGFVMGGVVRELLKKGDVLVLARYGEGRTRNALRDSYKSCTVNEFSWSMRKAGLHIKDTVDWLTWRGYTRVVGLGFGKGALALLTAADAKALDKVYAFNPWRGSEDIDMQPYDKWRGGDYVATRYLVEGLPSKQCGDDALLTAMEDALTGVDRAKLTAFTGQNTQAHLNQYNGWTKRYNALFGRTVDLAVGQFAYPWSAPAFNTDMWIDKVE